MNGYEPPRARFRRRVAEELGLMVQRARTLGGQPCFWVLELDRPTTQEAGVAVARRRRAQRRQRVIAVDGAYGETLPFERPGFLAPPPRPPRNRFVQALFAAGEPCFVLDLPNCTLDAPEAETLLRERPGFFRARERPGLGYSLETCEEHDPVCRQYLLGDEEDAAADVVYVLFDLYGLDVTTPLYVSAACFEGCRCWFERGVEIRDLAWPRPVGRVGCPRCRSGKRCT